jgi:hypothetical protein
MATMILLPDDTGATHPEWVAVGEATHHECLDDDNGSTSYSKCSTNLRQVVIEYANPSVAEADIASIESVRFLSSGRSNDRRNPSLVAIAFAAPTAGFSETVSYDAHAFSFETINGIARTASDSFATAWTYSALENLEMSCLKIGTQEVYLSYLALEVTYTPAVDNAVFFGTNF